MPKGGDGDAGLCKKQETMHGYLDIVDLEEKLDLIVTHFFTLY